MIPVPTTHASGEGGICSVSHFLTFAKQFANMRPDRLTRLPLVGSPLALRMQELINIFFVSVATGPLTAASAHKRSSFGVFDQIFGRAGRLKPVKVWR